MHKQALLKTLVALFLGISSSLADKITLKSGKVIEGKVLEERETEYLLEVYRTRTIKDRQTVLKSDVVSIEAEALDAKPYEKLKGTLPTPDQLSEGAYKLLIENKIRPFIEKFPKSEHLPEVKKMLATLEAELKRVQAGDVKLDGKWISASDWNSDAYELDAQLELSKMKKAASRSAYRRAMIAYDKLNKEFPGTQANTQAKEVAGQILPKYLRIISDKASKAKMKHTKRVEGIKSLPPQDRSRAQAAFDEEQARHATALKKAKDTRSKWLPAYEYDERTLKTIERNINRELRNTQRSPRKTIDMSEIYRKAWASASKGDETETKIGINTLRTKRIPRKYEQLLLAQLAANPAPETPKEEEKPEVAPEKPVEPKKEEKPKKRNKAVEPQEDASLEEEKEGSGMTQVVYLVLGLAVIGILVGVLLKGRKSGKDK